MNGVTATIMLFGGNFAPRSWGICNGAILPISTNTALFSLLGTTYGGDGRVTFGIPDFRGRVSAGTGEGPGLPNRNLGARWGSEIQALAVSQMPAHTHDIVSKSGAAPTLSVQVKASSTGDQSTPQDGYWSVGSALNVREQYPIQDSYSSSADITMASDAVQVSASGLTSSIVAGSTGGSQPFEISQPTLAVTHVICIEGIYPSRS